MPSLNTVIKQASRGADLYFVFRFLRLLTMKYEKTDAYKYGIIDKKGKPLKKSSDLESVDEKAPDTSDAMKRYRAGKAGFTDIAHLKAKGLIKRSDGTKRKSDKYKQGENYEKHFNWCRNLDTSFSSNVSRNVGYGLGSDRRIVRRQ